jgi:hypothetical protein
MQLPKTSAWTVWSIIFCPCNRINNYLEDLVADKSVDDELLSTEYSSGESNCDSPVFKG